MSADITVSDATIRLAHFQIVSDAGEEGKTTRSNYALVWDERGRPPPEVFPLAPIALYSRVTMDLDGGSDNAYAIRGTWNGPDGPRPFRIEDHTSFTIRFDCDETVPTTGTTDVGILFNLGATLQTIDFARLEEEDGELVLDRTQLEQFRAALQTTFAIDD